MEFYCSWVSGHQSARVSSRATPSWKYGSAVNFAAYDRKTWVFRVADKTYSFVDPIFDRGRMKSHTVFDDIDSLQAIKSVLFRSFICSKFSCTERFQSDCVY